jgi:uncharacterized protein
VKGADDPLSPNHFYPFCSERCKLIDLGRWLDGKYQIQVEKDPEIESEEREDKSE